MKTWLSPAIDLLGRVLKTRMFLAFLAIDCIFILIHIYVATRPWETPASPIEYLRIDKDRSLSEFFEYGALAAGLAATVTLIRQTRESAYWMVAALILYLLIDDAFAIHELLGPILDSADPAVGEALPSLVAGFIFLPWALICLWRSSGMTRTVLTAVCITVAYITFFGIGVDTLHGMYVAPFAPLDGPITVVEDGNELIGITLLGALMLNVRRQIASSATWGVEALQTA